MKNNVSRNVTLDASEKVIKNYKGLKAKGYLVQILLTNKRLVVYTYGYYLSRGRRTRQQRMNEIDLKSIHRFEYYIEYINNRLLVRFFGFLLFLASAYAIYMLYVGNLLLPPYPYSAYLNYVGAGLIMLIGLLFMFHVRKTLYMIIRSGLEEETKCDFKENKYNETALRFLAGKIHVN